MTVACNSSFVWIIALDQNDWIGTGLVLGSAEEVHTGGAEAYGVITALSFLKNYLAMIYPTDFSNTKPIQVFCDNQGVILQTQGLLPPYLQYP